MRYIIDAHAWIEYLEGGKKGESVNEILQSNNEKSVLPITIAEVVSKIKRKKGNFELAYKAIISNSQIINITPIIAHEAGLLHAEERKTQKSFGIVDSLLIAAAKFTDSVVLTGDRHFKKFKNVRLI